MFNPTSSTDSTFRIPRQCIWLKMNGSWPLQHKLFDKNNELSVFAILYTLWSWYVILSVGITIYFQTAFLFHSFGDIIMLTENCCTTFMGALNFVRLLHLRLHQPQFKQIIEQFVKEIWIVKGTSPRVERTCEKNMNIYRVMTVLLSLLIGMYCVLPLVELVMIGFNADEKPFPYKMIFPYNANHGVAYIFTYIFTAYAGICVVTTLFAEDSIFAFFVTYTCGQFQILHERIDQLIPTAHLVLQAKEKQITNAALQLEYLLQLKKIAQRHNTLIEFVNRLENFFNSILLVNFVISTILICMVGFQLVTGKDMFIGDYVKFIVYISSSLSQLYLLCWNGDNLIHLSSETANHLYSSNWEGNSKKNYEHKSVTHKSLAWHRLRHAVIDNCFDLNTLPATKEYRTNLQIMIVCSQRPLKITAFKFSTLSLQSFTRLLSTSLSYFTLLQTLYNEA